MSSFYGIFYRDKRYVTTQEALNMQQTFDWWKPDESDYIIQESILIGQATLYNTPESKYEHLPLKKANYILAMDARIDNREELAKELELPNRPLEEIGDSEFILASYHKWGKKCVDKLLGDFAFVIWDETKQELFCARDFIGVRPFYYYIDDEKFIFGSDMQSLVKSHNLPETIRDKSVANYLLNNQLTETKYTFLNSIKRLEGGCTIKITDTTIHTDRYWHPQKVKKIKLQTQEEWIKEIRNLIDNSIKARLRTTYPISSHLSGGLDSSPIAILASKMIKKTNPNYKLPVYSWQPQPNPEDDLSHFEWAYAIEVATQEDMKLSFSNLTTDHIIQGMKTHNLLYDKGSQFWYELDIRKDLKKQNIRTMLSGWGGDEFITNHGYAFYTQMLLQGRWIRFYKTLKNRIKTKDMSWKQTIMFLYKMVFIPILPTKLYCYLPKIHCKKHDISIYTNDFSPLMQEAYKQKNHIFSRYTSATIKADIIRAWENGHVQSRLNTWSQEKLAYKFEYTFPLLDKRVVELSLFLPTKWMLNDGFDRYLYRKSIEDIVPKSLLWGIHKSEPKRWENVKKIMQDTTRKLPKLINSKYFKKQDTDNYEEILLQQYFNIHYNKFFTVKR
jgi:asparagine synthase (glutamine-hydrolysing)